MKRFILMSMLGLFVMQIEASGNRDNEQSQESTSCCCISTKFVDQLKQSECRQNIVQTYEKKATPVNLIAAGASCCFFGGYLPGAVCCAVGCYKDYKDYEVETISFNQRRLRDVRESVDGENNTNKNKSMISKIISTIDEN